MIRPFADPLFGAVKHRLSPFTPRFPFHWRRGHKNRLAREIGRTVNMRHSAAKGLFPVAKQQPLGRNQI